MKKFILFIILKISLFGAYAQESTYPFNSISVDNGLNHTDATFLGQDKNGFIWISTYGGLNRYDGYEFKSFYNGGNANKNVYFNRISSFFIDNEGLIWLSTQGGIACFDTKKERFLKFFNENEKKNTINPVQGIVKIGEQIYCLYENGELVSYHLEKDNLVISKNNLPKINYKSSVIGTNKSKDEVWIGGSFGLIALKKNQEIVQMKLPNNSEATSVYVASNNQIIVGTTNGFITANKEHFFLKKPNAFTLYPINKVSIYPKLQVSDDLPLVVNAISEYKNTIWLATPNGLLSTSLTNPSQLYSYQNSELNQYSISSNHISSLLIDTSGSLWLGTFGGGICNTYLNPKYFQTIRKEPLSGNTLSGHYVRAIQESNDGLVWIGQHSHGLDVYNPKTRLFKHFLHNSGNSNSLISNNVRSILSSKDGKIWVGTDAGISILQPRTGVFNNITDKTGPEKSLTENVIFSLGEDKYGQVWAGSWSKGLNCIKKIAEGQYKVTQFFADKGVSKLRLAANRITFIYADEMHSDVLIGTEKGLDQITLNNKGEAVSIRHFQAFENKEASLSSEYIWPIVRSKDVIWVGTLGGGLNKIIPNKQNGYTAQHFTTENGLPSNDVESLLLDINGNLWIGGRGISHFDTKSNTFTNYDVNDGLQSNSFKIGSATYGKSGNMYFGGINGMSYFNPARIIKDNQAISVALSDLIINNKSIKANVAYEGRVIMEQSINDIEELELNYLENNFVIKFTALHFANPNKCKYRYKLEGYNDDWVNVSANNRSATFSNLAFNTFNFVVESSTDGINWSKQSRKLVINIAPPFWRSTAAKLFYLMIAFGLLYCVFYYLKKWVNLKNDYEKRIFEEQKVEELHQARLDFFTNISHEFRTPLTLITSPLENLIYNEPDPQGRQKTYKVIYSNAKRLLGLINELMDFRKVETEIVDVQISKANICNFTKEITNEFQELAYLRNINFKIENFGEQSGQSQSFETIGDVYFDKKILEKIIINLIGNAFKYSEDGSGISVKFLNDLSQFKPIFTNEFKITPDIAYNDFWWIKVQDNGIGISKESIANIFDRYYRVSEFEDDKHLGSGIGLALVKSLVNLHKGAIWVFSERNKGTEIMVGFSKDINVYDKALVNHFDNYELDTDQIQSLLELENINITNDLKETAPVAEDTNTPRQKILIVEDNQEMRSFLRENFEPEYEVIEAVDGVDGLEKAKTEFPSCIITDLMMPRMDGIELCQQLRKRIEVSHLPIILLTAKDTIDSRMEGAESGADVYFAKPFSFRILKLTVRNILEKHNVVKNRYQKDVFVQARELVSNQKEKDFIDNFINLIEANIENEELDIDYICVELGISRTNLYNKLKSITGQAVGDFVRGIRLRKAAQILATQDSTVLEAMYSVGFQSKSYFAKAFRKEFGKSPSEFIESMKNKENSN